MTLIEARNQNIFGILYTEEEGTTPDSLWYEENEDRNIVFAELRMAGELTITDTVTGKEKTICPLWFCRIDKDTEVYYNEARSVFT